MDDGPQSAEGLHEVVQLHAVARVLVHVGPPEEQVLTPSELELELGLGLGEVKVAGGRTSALEALLCSSGSTAWLLLSREALRW